MRSSSIAVLLTGGAAVFALVMNLLLWPSIDARLARADLSFREVLAVAFSDPWFGEVFWPSLLVHLRPRLGEAFQLAGSLGILLAAALFVGYWLRAPRQNVRFRTALWPAAIPLLLGLALFPLDVLGMAASLLGLREQGLANDGATANGAGAAFATPLFGALASALCVAFVAWSYSRSHSRDNP